MKNHSPRGEIFIIVSGKVPDLVFVVDFPAESGALVEVRAQHEIADIWIGHGE